MYGGCAGWEFRVSDESELPCLNDYLTLALGVQFTLDVLNMGAYGTHGDHKLLGDFFVAKMIGQQTQDLGFTLTEGRQGRSEEQRV
jgi:hypothetical protein